MWVGGLILLLMECSGVRDRGPFILMNESLLFVPPLVIFIIGSALIWALRDFALPSNAETSATNDRFRGAITGFIKIICEDNNPSEAQAAAYALASAAGFLVGFAAAKVGGSLGNLDYLSMCVACAGKANP